MERFFDAGTGRLEGREGTSAEDIAPAFEQAKALMAQYRVPVVVEVILERVTNISMGSELDNVMEFEDIADNAADAPTETCFMHYE